MLLISNCNQVETDYTPQLRQQLLVEKREIGDKTQIEKFAYVTKHLDVLRDGLISFSHDAKFRKLLYSEIDRRFDGDYNVLIKTLGNLSPGFLSKAFIEKNDLNGTFETSLDAFTGIVDSSQTINLYPQIFIPNYEALKEQGILSTATPTLISYNGEEPITQWEAIKLDGDKTRKIVIDEAYTKENEVWVISLNETYTGGEIVYQQERIEDQTARTACNYTTNLCQSSDNNWSHGILEKITVICSKESIFTGKSDVSDHSFSTFPENINPYNGSAMSPHWIGDSDHRNIIKMKTNVGSCWTLNFNFFPYWRQAGENPPNVNGVRGNLLFYVVYEQDNWPTGIRSKTLQHRRLVQELGGTVWKYTTLTIQYRSADSSYGEGIMDSFPKGDCGACDNFSHPCVQRIRNGCFVGQFKTSL